jgi:hypothetical protein
MATERIERALKVARIEASLTEIDPDEPAWKTTRDKLNEGRDRTTSLQNRVVAAEALAKKAAEKLKEAKQVVVEVRADVAFTKYQEITVELRELLATISDAAAAKLAALKAARDEFDAIAWLNMRLLAPNAIGESEPGLAIASYLVAVAEALLKNQKEAEASIALYEASMARRAHAQSPAGQAEVAREMLKGIVRAAHLRVAEEGR